MVSFPPIERRGQPHRAVDRTVDGLQTTFSTPRCRSCLERMADGVLLLDCETRVMYVTPQAEQILNRRELPFDLSPKFTLHYPQHASRFTAFVDKKNSGARPLSLLVEGENGRYPLLLNFFQLPKPAEPDLYTACYMVMLRDPNYCSSHKWLQFNEQFNLTPAESRLCRTLAEGLTLNDYCEKWKVAVSTARSQLSSVFGKTSTRRQSDLLRLIFLFTYA